MNEIKTVDIANINGIARIGNLIILIFPIRSTFFFCRLSKNLNVKAKVAGYRTGYVICL